MSIIRVAIEYDTDAETAIVKIGNEHRQWHSARLITDSGLTETADGYWLPISGPQRALIFTGVPT